MNRKKKSLKGLAISIISLAIFALLMIFGLKHNPNFTPSQLIGKKAPEFEAPLVSGGFFKFNASNTLGHWKVINFWSSSCYVCRNEAHDLQDFYQTVSIANPNNPQLISLNIQDNNNIIYQWQKDYSQNFPVIQDLKGLISVSYGVTGTPETFFIDSNNIVRYRIAGEVNKTIILNFIEWLDKNPNASEEEATKALAATI